MLFVSTRALICDRLFHRMFHCVVRASPAPAPALSEVNINFGMRSRDFMVTFTTCKTSVRPVRRRTAGRETLFPYHAQHKIFD